MHSTATLGCCLTPSAPHSQDMGTNLPPSAGYYLPRQYCSSALPPPASPQMNARLENKDLWEKFNSVGTEMILTKNGRRMFPEFSVSLSGLDQHRHYSLCVQAVPEGENRYKWRDGIWSRSGRAEPGPPTRLYLHPESPAPGHRWMERPVCFNKIRLTNNTLSQGGQIVLQSMHRYALRLYIIPTSNGGSPPRAANAMSFPETSFIAVTSYQNPKLSLLKIEENPFAKGIKYFKHQQESHTPKKRICRPEQNGGDSERKRPKGSGQQVPASPAGGEESPAVSEESSEEAEERREPSGEEERAETRAPGRDTSRACERKRSGGERDPERGGDTSRACEGRRSGEERDPERGRDTSRACEGRRSGEERDPERGRDTSRACEGRRSGGERDRSAGKREDGGQRTDMIVQWGPLTQRAPWLPPLSPLSLTPYPPAATAACLMPHRYAHSFAAVPPVPPSADPYFLSPWTSPSGGHSHPGLHPHFFQQQLCAAPWYLSPQLTSRGL